MMGRKLQGWELETEKVPPPACSCPDIRVRRMEAVCLYRCSVCQGAVHPLQRKWARW